MGLLLVGQKRADSRLSGPAPRRYHGPMLAYLRKIGRTRRPWLLSLWAVLAFALALNFARVPQLQAAAQHAAMAEAMADSGHMPCCDECADMAAMGCAKAVVCATVCAPIPQRVENVAVPLLKPLETLSVVQEASPRSHPPDPLRRPPRLA